MVDSAARFLANDAIFLLVAMVLVFGLIQLRDDWRRGTQIGLAAILAALIGGGILLAVSSTVHESRPFVHDSDTVLLIHHAANNGFPSDHATLSAVVAVVAALAWPRWSAAFLVFAVILGLSRVFVGVHYPGDVLAGWAIGAFAAIVAWFAVAHAPRALPGLRDRSRRAETVQ